MSVAKFMQNFQYPTDVQETELAYLAGIIDGEGTITVLRTQKHYKQTTYFILQPQVSVYGTSELLMDWLQDRMGFKPQQRDRRHWHTSYAVQVWGYKVHALLKPLLPHLLVKRSHAEQVIRYCEMRAVEPYNRPYSTEELAVWTEVQRLNWKRSYPFTPNLLPSPSTT